VKIEPAASPPPVCDHCRCAVTPADVVMRVRPGVVAHRECVRAAANP